MKEEDERKDTEYDYRPYEWNDEEILDDYADLSTYECSERRPLTAEETIEAVISIYMAALEELKNSEEHGEKLSDYAQGVKSAYVETLQLFQLWEKQEQYGLNFDLEKLFDVK